MLAVEAQNPLAHGEVLVPSAELHLRRGDGVVALHDGGFEGHRQRRVQEVEQVCCGWAESLDPLGVEAPDGVDECGLVRAAGAAVEEPGESEVVLPVLVNVRNAQLWLPEECVIDASEDLALLGDRAHNRL